MEKKIKTKKDEDLISWYNETVTAADLAEFSELKGFTIYKPYGYAIWEKIRDYLDDKFKNLGIKNAYFPLLIPESVLEKEKEHVEGFTPEVAWVTMGGKKKLDEKLAVRPTSETSVSYAYSKWVKSYRDLPLMMNQWNTVVRWETKETRLFLRGREVIWQEGHCVFENEEEARKNVMDLLMVYKEVLEELLATPVIIGRKSEEEKFAGAVETYTVEAPLPNNFMIQSATSHLLGQNFSKVFDIKFLNRENKWEYAHQTSWGISMRSIGAMILVHGDDNGLILPPLVAPIQVIIIPILNGTDDKKIIEYARDVEERLKKINIRAEIDDRTIYSPGWKFNEYELKGVPIRIDLGKKETEERLISYKIRVNGKKESVKFDELNKFTDLLENIQEEMFQRAYDRIKSQVKEETNKNEFIKDLKDGKAIVKAAWCGKEACEKKIKEQTGAVSRVIPLEKEELLDKKCIFCGKPAEFNAYFAQTY